MVDSASDEVVGVQVVSANDEEASDEETTDEEANDETASDDEASDVEGPRTRCTRPAGSKYAEGGGVPLRAAFSCVALSTCLSKGRQFVRARTGRTSLGRGVSTAASTATPEDQRTDGTSRARVKRVGLAALGDDDSGLAALVGDDSGLAAFGSDESSLDALGFEVASRALPRSEANESGHPALESDESGGLAALAEESGLATL
eukprot:4359513-Pleurochrysis_carterae.AAC.3